MADRGPEAPSCREQAAHFLEACTEELFDRWERQVRNNIPAAKHQEKLLLRNHLRPYFSTVAETLRSCTARDARERLAQGEQFDSSPNRTHGRLRATLPGYTAEQVVDEYITLRHVVTDAIAEQNLLDEEVLEVVAAVNERAITHAVTQFGNSLQVLRQKAVSMLMHDVRNPLNVVSITAELLKHRVPEQATMVDTILSNTAKIDYLVTELLDAVRLEAGQGLELQFTSTDLREVILMATEGAKLAYPGRVQLCLPEHPAPGDFDLSGMARALENLLANAIKYGHRTEKVTIQLSSDSRSYSISVHNWGEPIDDRDQATIFVTFARSQDPAKNHLEQGWGLGLAYVKAVAEGHGGTVHAESNVNQGTTFRMILPRKNPHA